MQVALLLGTMAICFFIAEIAYRIYARGKFRRDAKAYAASLYQLSDDPKLVYRLSPNFRAELPFQYNPEKKFSIVTNNEGFRGPDIGPKADGIARILFIGDSYPFGWGLDDESASYPRQTERILNDAAGRNRYEVINAGTPGYNTEMESALLRQIAPEVKPDAVVLSYITNDAEPQATVIPSPAQLYRGYALWLPERLQEGANSIARRLGAGPLFRIEKRWADPEFDYRRGFEKESYKWRESKAALAEMAALCRERGIPLFVFVFPDFYHALDETYPFDGIREAVTGWCEELQIPHHDLMGEFRGRDRAQVLLPEETHPNAETHREIAEIIARELQASPAFPAP